MTAMADKNEPGGGVVPSALTAYRNATRDDRDGVARYAIAAALVAAAIITTLVLA